MIYFKPVIVKDCEAFIKKYSFPTLELKDLDYEKDLQKQLKKLFKTDFIICRAFLVLNRGTDIIIYVYVIPNEKISLEGYEWTPISELDPEKFDSFDEVGINAFLANY